MTIKGLSLSDAIKVPPTPFPGLRPFEFHESDLFFGRDGQVEKLIIKLAGARFVAVVGTSGSGKSSLVRAGLMPALVSGMMESAGTKWHIAVMRPGNDPIGSLSLALNQPEVFGSDDPENAAIQIVVTEATLRRGSRGLVEAVRQNAMGDKENLLVVVDQFEELFRFAREASRKTKEESERYQNDAAAFVKLLLEAKSQREVNIFVVLTMRSDFLGDCAKFWDLPEAINESQYLIPRLTRDQLREVITGPVALGGAEITPRLITQLLNDIGDNQDQLPVLQHLLMRVWDEWKHKQLEVEVKEGNVTVRRPHREVHEAEGLDLCCYYAVGGMAEALSRHADEAFNELPDERHREVTEKLFKALTEKGPDNREIRRPIMLGEICTTVNATEPEAITVIEAFRHPQRSFLMPPAGVALNAESLIDISHESLIRGWDRLELWVEDEARSARIYRRLAETAALHREGHAGLWGDPDLQLALDWREKNGPNQEWARRYHPQFETAIAFLNASEQKRARDVAESERRQQEEVERAKRELEQAQELAEAQQRRAEAEQQKAAEQAKASLRLQRLLGLLGALFLLAVASTVFAFSAYRKADAETKNAERAARLAEEQRQLALTATADAQDQKSIAVIEKDKAVKASAEADAQKLVAIREKENAVKAAREAERQKQFALDQKTAAVLATNEAESERQKAIASQRRTLQFNYVANINLAQRAFDEGNRGRAEELLLGLLPATPTEGDVRDFTWYRLWRLNHNELFTFTGHNEPVTSVAFAPDGKTLVSASTDSTVKLWDLTTKQESGTINAQAGAVGDVAFSPDGSTFATANEDGTVKFWDSSTKQELGTLNAHEGIVHAVAFSPDRRMLASAGENGTVKLWDVSTKRELSSIKGGAEPLTAMAFSPDSKMLAAGRLNTLELWDVSTTQELSTLKGHQFRINAVAFTPDGKTLASGSEDGTVKVWDLRTKQELTTLKAHEMSLSTLVKLTFSPDSKTLALSSDNTVKLLNLSTKEEKTLKGHQLPVYAVAFSPDGKTLASGGLDGTVRLWDASPKKEMSTLKGSSPVADVDFSPDGRTLASASGDTVKLWDVSANQELGTFKGHKEPVTAVAFSPDGRIVASAGEARFGRAPVKLWDVRTMQELSTLNGHTGSVSDVAFSRDGKMLASASNDTTVKLWDVNTMQQLGTLKGHEVFVFAVAFSPDGKMLASASHSGAVKLWDVNTMQELGTLNGHGKETVSAVAFSPDGKTLASGGTDSIVKLWNVSTRREVATLKGHQGLIASVVDLAFSPDGKTLVSASFDKTLKLWDVSTGQELLTLRGEDNFANAVAFSPDGKTLAGAWNNILLWYAATDAEVAAQRNK